VVARKLPHLAHCGEMGKHVAIGRLRHEGLRHEAREGCEGCEGYVVSRLSTLCLRALSAFCGAIACPLRL
jgi:hypothetical protein